MHCDHHLITTHLFDYLDGNLSATEKRKCETALQQCETCQTNYQQAIRLQQISQQWQQQPVPEWHRTQYAVRPVQKSFRWLSWSALATSTLALLMVLFQIQITSNEQGFSVAFGSQNTAQFESLLEQRMRQFKAEQSIMLDARLVAHSDKLQTTQKLMVAEAMEKTRHERRDDLSFLITGIQTQRFEDQAKVEKRLSYLADNQIENNQYINQLIQSANSLKGDQ